MAPTKIVIFLDADRWILLDALENKQVSNKNKKVCVWLISVHAWKADSRVLLFGVEAQPRRVSHGVPSTYLRYHAEPRTKMQVLSGQLWRSSSANNSSPCSQETQQHYRHCRLVIRPLKVLPMLGCANVAIRRCISTTELRSRICVSLETYGVKHLNRLGPYHGGYSVFGGIDYVRHDVLPDLPELSSDADSGCQFCAAVKRALHEKYRESALREWSSEGLTLRTQYGWTVYPPFSQPNALVVSVRWDTLGGWQKGVLQFPIYAVRGTPQ